MSQRIAGSLKIAVNASAFAQDQQLVEYHDIAEIYAQIEAVNQGSSTEIDTDNSPEPASLRNTHHAENDDNHDNRIHEEDTLLEKLLELEAKLEADQKPKFPTIWQEEIAKL